MDWGNLAQEALLRLQWAVLGYFVLVNGLYGLLLFAAALEMRRHLQRVWGESRWRILGSEVAPSLTMLAPAYNEAATIVQSIRALLGLEYPSLSVIVVNDGSTDGTLEILLKEFDMFGIHPIYRRRLDTQAVEGIYRSRINPNLVVVDKVNGGKADALNAGLNVATGELVCAVDADTLVEADALLRMVRPFLIGEGVVAAGGTIRIANASEVRAGRVASARVPRSPLAGFQVGEYLRAFLFGRLGWNRLGGNLIISGAFGLFRREQVIRAGGYLHETVGEDIELVARLRKLGYDEGTLQKVEFIPDPVAWTEAPQKISVLARQRDRWHRGLFDVLWRYQSLLFRPRYRALGFVVYPYFLFIELLAPVVEFIGVLGLVAGLALDVVDLRFAALFLLLAYGLGMVLTLYSMLLEEFSYHRYETFGDRMMMIVWALLENLGYRQLTVLWRLRGMFKFLRGRKEWGEMTRAGFRSSPEDPQKSADEKIPA